MRAAHQVKALRIILTSIQKLLQSVTGIAVLTGGDIRRTNLAPDFMLRVELIALDDLFEMTDGFVEPVLCPGDPAELVMCIEFIRVDFNGALKTLARLIQLTSVLVNQAKIVVRRGISRIDRRRFKILFESRARALLADNAAEIST